MASSSCSLQGVLDNLSVVADPLPEETRSRLAEFDCLSEAEKEAARAATIDRVFPLALGGNAAIAESATFEELLKSPWSTNCWLTPRVIVTPSTAQEVAAVVSLCRFVGAKFSVRGGGHLQNPGFTSNNGGVVISLSKFTQLSVSEDKSAAHIGVGLNWLDVYKGLEPYNVTVTGGRVPSVGVPGLLLGGGLSFQNSEQGLSCMGVANYTVVLADSTVVNANEKENTDLFWALKGGGPNFGIVTEVTMRTVPTGVWAEGRLFSPESNKQLLGALMRYHEASENDDKATLIWHFGPEVTLLVFFYCAPVENPEVFRCFDDVPYIGRLVEPGCRTVYEVVEGFASVNAGEQKIHEMRTMSSLPDQEVYKAAEECRLQQIEATKDVEGANLTMVIQPMASNAINAGDARGGNPLGLKAQGHQWFLIMADWKHETDTKAMREACRKIVDVAESVAKKNSTYLPFRYSNYSAPDQDPLASYGAENLQKLKDIALKYDPEGVWQTLQNSGWLLSKAGLPYDSARGLN